MKEALMVQAFAINAEIEGMKIANRIAEIREEYPQYGDSDFVWRAERLEQIALELKQYN